MFTNPFRAPETALDSVNPVSIDLDAGMRKPFVEQLNEAIANDQITATELKVIKDKVNRQIEIERGLWKDNWYFPLLKKFREENPFSQKDINAELDDLYYQVPQLHTLNSYRKLANKVPDEFKEGRDIALDIADKWQPVADAVKYLKDRIVKKVVLNKDEKREKAAIPKTAKSADLHKVVKQAIEDQRPELEADYRMGILSTFNYLVRKYGEIIDARYFAEVNPVHWERTISKNDRIAINFIWPYLKEQTAKKPDWNFKKSEIDDKKLDKEAGKYVDDIFLQVVAKVMEKAGEIENPKVKDLQGTSFEIMGTMKGRDVRIEQTIIINRSALGTMFNQFPARIYVDGKFMSEAAYKTFMTKESAMDSVQPYFRNPMQRPTNEGMALDDVSVSVPTSIQTGRAVENNDGCLLDGIMDDKEFMKYTKRLTALWARYEAIKGKPDSGMEIVQLREEYSSVIRILQKAID